MNSTKRLLLAALSVALVGTACKVPTDPRAGAPVAAPAANAAPVTPGAPAAAPAANTPPTGGPWINNSLLPQSQTGLSDTRLQGAWGDPTYSDGVGAFRTLCKFSHMAYDDPIMFPGRPGASHLHTFFGNTGINANSDSNSIANSGSSTCSGGTLNRSGYWIPSMIDTATGAPVEPDFMFTYYKTGYAGVKAWQVVTMPAGLRMISGDARATAGFDGPWYERHMGWTCKWDSEGHGTDGTTGMQNCSPGQWASMWVNFPQCWDGYNLDSADHKSHMAFPDSNGCPSSHPIAVPEVTFVVYWRVPDSGNSTWRLSSDMYSDSTAGYSGHADWWNGWDANTMQTFVSNCLNPGVDCSVDLLGNGQMLTGV